VSLVVSVALVVNCRHDPVVVHLFEDPFHVVAVLIAGIAKELEAGNRAESHASTQLAPQERVGGRETVTGET
jgi:hypothetical protein